MHFYRDRYYVGNDFDADTTSTKMEETRDRRGVVVAKAGLTPKSIVCHIANPMLVALEASELRKRCYNCYAPEEDLLGLEATRANDGKFDKLIACDDCEMVYFCSLVSKGLAPTRLVSSSC